MPQLSVIGALLQRDNSVKNFVKHLTTFPVCADEVYTSCFLKEKNSQIFKVSTRHISKINGKLMVAKAPFLQVTPEGICVWVKPAIIPRPLHPQGREFSLES